MEVLDAIRRKRAVRRYNGQPIPDEAVERILYAGRRAQSSKNSQPWQFIVVRDPQTLQALAQLGDFSTHLPSAAMAIGILTPDPLIRWSVMFDAGQAAAYMQLEGVELGIGSCITTLHRPDPAHEILGFPEDLHLHMVIAFGYPADPEAAFAPASRPQGRRSADEIVHFESYTRADS